LVTRKLAFLRRKTSKSISILNLVQNQKLELTSQNKTASLPLFVAKLQNFTGLDVLPLSGNLPQGKVLCAIFCCILLDGKAGYERAEFWAKTGTMCGFLVQTGLEKCQSSLVAAARLAAV
jgi:hypothetical protein